jgi:hypothetical protein
MHLVGFIIKKYCCIVVLYSNLAVTVNGMCYWLKYRNVKGGRMTWERELVAVFVMLNHSNKR